jgi:hypothetical protein
LGKSISPAFHNSKKYYPQFDPPLKGLTRPAII